MSTLEHQSIKLATDSHNDHEIENFTRMLNKMMYLTHIHDQMPNKCLLIHRQATII